MLRATQPDIALTRCGDSEFYRVFTVGMAGFGYNTHKRQSPPGSQYYLAQQGQTLAGFVKFSGHEAHGNLYVHYLEVQQHTRGQGLAGKLLSALFDEAANRKLDILLSPYTALGRQHLPHYVESLQKSHPGIGIYYEQC